MVKLRAPTVALFLFLLVAPSAFAQQTEVIYPNGLVVIAAENLPPKVYLAQKNTLEIGVKFFYRGRPKAVLSTAQASGFIEKKSGYVVTARHTLVETMINLWYHQGEFFRIDENGIPKGEKYDYEFNVILHTPTSVVEYPLELKTIGKMGTHVDVMIFKPSRKIPIGGLELFLNPKVGDKVYSSGFTTSGSHYHNADGRTINIQTDNGVKFNFENTITAILENKTITSFGLKRLYRMAGTADFGFSGGPVIHKNGQAVGITIEGDYHFLYSVSAQDIDALIRSVK